MSATISIVPGSEDVIENASEINQDLKPARRNIFTRITSKIQHTASNIAHKTTRKAGEIADNTKTRVKVLASKAKNQAETAVHNTSDKAGEIADKAKTHVSQVAHNTSDKVSHIANKASTTVSNTAGQVYGNVKDDLHYRRNRAHYAEAVKKWDAGSPQFSLAEAWVTLKTDLAPANAWVQQLSEKKLQDFTDGMAQHLESLGFNIDWLVTERFPLNPNLHQHINDVALFYSLSAWRAQQNLSALNAQLAYEAWTEAPEKHKQYGQKLYEKLDAQNLVTIPSEVVFADEKARISSLVKIAKDTYTLHPDKFNAILNELATPAA
ncbi:MAG: hypothetical protein WCL57_20070 [Chloroflexota bacterium]